MKTVLNKYAATETEEGKYIGVFSRETDLSVLPSKESYIKFADGSEIIVKRVLIYADEDKVEIDSVQYLYPLRTSISFDITCDTERYFEEFVKTDPIFRNWNFRYSMCL